MMAEDKYAKYVAIACGKMELSHLRGVTKTKVSEEIDSDLIKTFDDPIPVPASDGGYTIDIDVLETRNVEDFITLEKLLLAMKKTEGTISITETHMRTDGNVKVEEHHSGCLLASNEAELSPEDLTAKSLSFKSKSRVKKINGTEIKVD
jgi:hypothetical protein